MAWDSSAQAFILTYLLLVGLLAASARAEPELTCPDYVAAHAPLLWLHSDDPYKPSDILEHVRHTTPVLDGQPIDDVPSLDLDNLELLNEFGEDVALTSNDDPTTKLKWLYGEAPDAAGQVRNATPCVVILVERSELDVDAFYFYFYSYNEGPNITQVLEPLDRLADGGNQESGMHFGNHVGDWEHNMVRFQDGQPVGIYYSQHVDGVGYDWDDPTVSKVDERPVVYSARGSHANYATTGDQVHNIALVDYCDAGQKWDPILSAYFYRFDPDAFTLTSLAPPGQSSSSPPSMNLTSFFYYTGHWGDIQYPDSDPRQDTVAFGLKRFQTGPTGPRAKHLVRKGLLPDKRRKAGWTEWAVGVYMSLYPCCLKGWRAWVSAGLFITVLVAVVLGIRFGVRRYRSRTTGTYRKLQVEDIPLDDWRSEEEDLFSSDEEVEDLGREENNH